jgi:hypothetical protein
MRLDYERADDRRWILRDLRDGIITCAEAIEALVAAGDSEAQARQRVAAVRQDSPEPRSDELDEPPHNDLWFTLKLTDGATWWRWKDGQLHPAPPPPGQEPGPRPDWPDAFEYQPVYRNQGINPMVRLMRKDSTATPRHMVRALYYNVISWQDRYPDWPRFVNARRQALRHVECRPDPVTDDWRLPEPESRP